ncbi:MAG TPA: bifunctional metallophosphatase/5'-nucleotidase [Nevskiaceae bacterium]|nr:bifunctional metallophosphatase/5'-nucleotidase [Nevskiaceae bacterium]
MSRRSFPCAVLSSLLLGCASLAPLSAQAREVPIQILAINDFHGNLEAIPSTSSSGRVGSVPAGGAEFLSTHIANLRAQNPEGTIVVSAGDLIGASPLLSGLFHDEPTIEAMNQIGLDFNAVGNHEFDEGIGELRRMQKGGCHPVDGCQDGDGFDGADFRFIAANVVRERDGRPLLRPFGIRTINGVRVGFIGMTLEATPTIVSAAGIRGFEFRDEADTANALIPELRRRNVDVIVVLVHEGGFPATFDVNGCQGVSGPIVDIVNRLDPAVDLVISGHTHQPYNCVINGIPTTSAFSFGRVVTEIDLTVDRRTSTITSMTINNQIVTRDVPQDGAITQLIEKYRAAAAPIANRPVGRITAEFLRTNDDSLEQVMGNAIADAQRFASEAAGAELAFMNPGGVRADLSFASSSAGEGDGVVTYGELFSVQPFGNGLLTMTLTGAQIDEVLERQFCGINSPANNGFFRVLLPSAGVRYSWSEAAAGQADCATANAVDPLTVEINGEPLDLARSYRVTVNTFLADGGDGFPIFTQGTERVGGVVDTDAFEQYLQANAEAGLSPPAQDRITKLP